MVESFFFKLFLLLLFYHLGTNYSAQPSHKNKDDLFLSLFLTKAESHPEYLDSSAQKQQSHGAHCADTETFPSHLQEALTVFTASRGHQITHTDLCFTAH